MEFIAAIFCSLYVIIGILTYAFTDGWTLIDSVYFTVQTITTVGACQGRATAGVEAGRQNTYDHV